MLLILSNTALAMLAFKSAAITMFGYVLGLWLVHHITIAALCIHFSQTLFAFDYLWYYIRTTKLPSCRQGIFLLWTTTIVISSTLAGFNKLLLKSMAHLISTSTSRIRGRLSGAKTSFKARSARMALNATMCTARMNCASLQIHMRWLIKGLIQTPTFVCHAYIMYQLVHG